MLGQVAKNWLVSVDSLQLRYDKMTPDFNIDRARAETPATESLIHFNNAGASLMPAPVSHALHDYLYEEERLGGYETTYKYADGLNGFYDATATLLNCSPEEIAYAENATRAWDMAFYAFQFQPGDKILTTMAEYGSNVIAYLHQAKRQGVELVFVPNDEHGQIDTVKLEQMIDDRVKLISISHIPTGGGLVNPAKEVGRIANAAGIPYLLDACQAVGQLVVDVQDIGCDMLSGTGRKYLRGPRGTGFLYVRQSLISKLDPPLLDQHAAELISPSEYRIRPDAKRFENWEQFFAGKYALGKAIEYALQWGMPQIEQRVCSLADHLRAQLSDIKGVNVTDLGAQRCGIVTFQPDTVDPDAVRKAMALEAINVCVSDGSGSLVSYQDRGIKATVRASVHYYNTEVEIERFIQLLAKQIKA